ncbi:hypothetical protein GF385_03435 [Candidatus Dependentiae bacterium]|nr:hypothetical protein [Candidatus Dependentiae bacterium]
MKKIILSIIFSLTSISIFGMADLIAEKKYLKKQQRTLEKLILKEKTKDVDKIIDITKEILREVVIAYRNLEKLEDPFYIVGQSIKSFIDFFILNAFEAEKGRREHVGVIEKVRAGGKFDFFFDGSCLNKLMNNVIEANNRIITLNKKMGFEEEESSEESKESTYVPEPNPSEEFEEPVIAQLFKEAPAPVAIVAAPFAFTVDVVSTPIKALSDGCSII